MRRLSLVLNTLILGLLITLFSPVPRGEVVLSKSYLDIVQQNRTVITCYDNNDNIWGGQGTITQVDQLGVWVTTAGHVTHDSSHCDVMFRDGSTHTAHLVKAFDKSDVAVLFVSRAYWPTHASIASLKIGSKLFNFGEINKSFVLGDDGDIEGFMFIFNDKTYEGRAIARMPASLIRYPVNKGNLVLTNLYSRPGSSGGGVFDENGNLVGLVSGGSVVDPYITYIVDVSQSFDEEYAAHPEEIFNVKVTH
jgi:Trypsin-like peptidase domain